MLNLDKPKEPTEVKTEDGTAKPNVNDNFGLRLDQYAKKNAYMKVSSCLFCLFNFSVLVQRNSIQKGRNIYICRCNCCQSFY